MLEKNEDFSARSDAIDINQSCIVQAPAGSGKTELLTQRYLNLLANAVEEPEEIIAITFTQKAAQEMRHRVITSLQRALTLSSQPAEEPARTNWALAKLVLTRSAERHWHLLDNPQRLNIYTFDGLALNIVEQLPLLSKQGHQVSICEDPEPLYKEAIQNMLSSMDSDTQLQPAILSLLNLLDNQIDRFSRFMIALLSRRDQWVNHLIPYYNHPALWRDLLTQSWQEVESYYLTMTASFFSNKTTLFKSICASARFALLNLPDSFFENQSIFSSTSRRDIQQAFDTEPDPAQLSCHAWQFIALLFTRKDGSKRAWRTASAQGIAARIGFPTANKTLSKDEQTQYKQAKIAMIELVKEVSQYNQLKDHFAQLLSLPDSDFSDTQWQLMEALLKVLPHALAELEIAMRTLNKRDFTAVALGALGALGDADTPSDILLKLDYQIKHLLVDEFQDTSITQFQLVERLVSNWIPDDGRSLFIVGDPMQSIYRFREADVSLFYKARREGIGNVNLNDLRLTLNFRSNANLIEWFNTCFSQIFPKMPDSFIGSVCYEVAASLQAVTTDKKGTPTDSTSYHIEGDARSQMQSISNEIKQIIVDQPDASIAVLVRNRSHTQHLFQSLRSNNISYHATNMEQLDDLPEILDLVSLATALFDWHDSLAWVSLLRSPFCGLTLSSIQAIIDQLKEEGISLAWPYLARAENNQLLDQDSIFRLSKFNQRINHQLQFFGKVSARRLISSTWHQLGGHIDLDTSTQPDIDTFFDLVDTFDEGGFLDTQQLCIAIKQAYTNRVPKDPNPVQIMTIHKSKGLEFDYVFIPQLEASGRPDDPSLLLWQYSLLPNEKPILLMAPNKGVEHQQSAKYEFLTKTKREQAQQELIRLFYVAATRAKEHLYLYSSYRERSDKQDTILGLLANQTAYLAAKTLYEELLPTEAEQLTAEETNLHQADSSLYRLKMEAYQDWHHQVSTRLTNATHHLPKLFDNPIIDLKLVNQRNQDQKVATQIGTLVHDWMDNIVKSKAPWDQALMLDIETKQHIRNEFVSNGIAPEELENAIAFFCSAIENIRTETKLKKLITESDQNNLSEVSISYNEKNKEKYRTLDFFTIDEKNQIWILDYKLSLSSETSEQIKNRKSFTEYKKQLEDYASLVSRPSFMSQIKLLKHTNRLPTKPIINCVLYFPLQRFWHQWAPEVSAPNTFDHLREHSDLSSS